jgi:pre-60S factor REI1
MRAHYKSDWHRYNLKRKVADMPCVSAAEFRARAAMAGKLAEEAQAAEDSSMEGLSCETCAKKFSSSNAMKSHVESKKHKLAVAATAKAGPKQPADPKATAGAGAAAGKAPAAPETMPPMGPVDAEMAPAAGEEGGEEEPVELAVTDCIFCSHQSETLEDNLRHMVCIPCPCASPPIEGVANHATTCSLYTTPLQI